MNCHLVLFFALTRSLRSSFKSKQNKTKRFRIIILVIICNSTLEFKLIICFKFKFYNKLCTKEFNASASINDQTFFFWIIALASVPETRRHLKNVRYSLMYIVQTNELGRILHVCTTTTLCRKIFIDINGFLSIRLNLLVLLFTKFNSSQLFICSQLNQLEK